jgi:hypothetical protein
MTDQQTPSLANTSQEAAAQATARATAGQAHRQATRPWFKKKRIALPSAVILTFLILMLTTGGNDPGIFDFTTSAVESQVEIAANVPPPNATIGKSVRDGKFAFVVTSIQKSSRTITDRLGATETAQGVFVIIRIDVTNIGDQARTLNATDQYVVNDKGQRFATSSAISSVNGAETILVEKINPGRTVTNAPLLFDVPAGTTIASIELHDALSSTGAKVRLT